MATLASDEPASLLALSADQLALACVCQNSVAFFSMPDLAVANYAKGPDEGPPTIRPVTQLSLGAAIKQFVWCKAQGEEAGVQRYLVVTDDHKCLVRACGDALLPSVLLLSAPVAVEKSRLCPCLFPC
jgi:hypothetical protein